MVTKNKLFSFAITFLLSVVLLSACDSSRSVEKLFHSYSQKKGFRISVSNSDLHFDFARDKEVIQYLNSVNHFYTLHFNAGLGRQKEFMHFVKSLQDITQQRPFHLIMEVEAGGKLAAYYRKNKKGEITGFLFIKEGSTSSTWIWAPAEKTGSKK